MSKPTPKTGRQKELANFRELRQTVLRHLMEGGPTNWDALCGKINHDRAGELVYTLRLLARRKHVAICVDIVNITDLGIRQLRFRA
jgi:hypothetical protein